MTVMFCEIVPSTSLSTQIDPENLRDLTDAYHEVVAETVQSFDGFVAQYLADGVLIYFGYPQAHEDDAESAVRAGLAVIHATAELSESAALQVRIGIATGIVVVRDSIGLGDSQELGALGGTPKLAARIATLAEPDTIVVAEGTRRQLVGLFDLDDLGPQELKGFAQPQHAWRLLGESDVVSPIELPARDEVLPRDTPLRRRVRRRHGHRKSLSLVQNLLILVAVIPLLWLIFSKIERPTANETTTKTAGSASEPAPKATQADTQSEQADQDNPLATRILETRLGRVLERNKTGDNADGNDLAPRLAPSKQVPIDDKLTAEEVFASRNQGEVQLPGPINVRGETCKGCLTAEALSESERLRYVGLVVIHRMAALTLYNKRCLDIAHLTDDKAEALDMIESQFKELPSQVQEKALDHQTKNIQSRSAIYHYTGRLMVPGGFQWFCSKMTDAIKDGEADPMFKAAREGFSRVEAN